MRNLVVNNRLNRFLYGRLNTGTPIKLWIIDIPFRKKGLAALQVDEGKKYAAAPFSFFTITFLGLILSAAAFSLLFANSYFLVGIGSLVAAEVIWLVVLPLADYCHCRRDGVRM